MLLSRLQELLAHLEQLLYIPLIWVSKLTIQAGAIECTEIWIISEGLCQVHILSWRLLIWRCIC